MTIFWMLLCYCMKRKDHQFIEIQNFYSKKNSSNMKKIYIFFFRKSKINYAKLFCPSLKGKYAKNIRIKVYKVVSIFGLKENIR